MVTNIQQESTAAHYSNSREEDGVLQSYDSISSLVDDIKTRSSGMFEALSLVNEVNYLNGCKLIGDYEIANIKRHFRNIKISEIKTGLLKGSNPKNQNNEIVNMKYPQIKSGNRQRVNFDNVEREMRKGYMQLLSV